ncbi:type II toxin-antitoxin system RelB family antitoxin [Fusobacterium sp. PH5-44]|uniref:type II toxin-antitoxin system RelB family antitoxin n=1 Tax=unclassified Fusobacterium TaxID=2648384 RepID=UPI003D25B1D4
MSVISIRFNEEEEEIIRKYIESKGTNISQYVKELIFNSIEDEYDLKVLKDYEKRISENKVKLIPYEDAIKEWDL